MAGGASEGIHGERGQPGRVGRAARLTASSVGRGRGVLRRAARGRLGESLSAQPPGGLPPSHARLSGGLGSRRIEHLGLQKGL